jgi:hypothetical protein
VSLLKITKRRIKKKNLFSKQGTGIRMQRLERKDMFIKDDITRDIDSSGSNFKAFDTFVTWAVA